MNPKVANNIQRLQAGETIVNKEGGNSMTPLIYSRQPVTIEPVDPTKLEKGDIVYAKVRGRVHTHLVSAVRKGEVQISNNKGHVNGWTKLHNVYGIITEIDGKPILSAKNKTKQ